MVAVQLQGLALVRHPRLPRPPPPQRVVCCEEEGEPVGVPQLLLLGCCCRSGCCMCCCSQPYCTATLCCHSCCHSLVPVVLCLSQCSYVRLPTSPPQQWLLMQQPVPQLVWGCCLPAARVAATCCAAGVMQAGVMQAAAGARCRIAVLPAVAAEALAPLPAVAAAAAGRVEGRAAGTGRARCTRRRCASVCAGRVAAERPPSPCSWTAAQVALDIAWRRGRSGLEQCPQHQQQLHALCH